MTKRVSKIMHNGTEYVVTPDLSGYQTKANMVTSLTGADNTHYPSAKAVSDAISGAGDMLASVYDPNGVGADAFDYSNFTNTPTIPSNTSDLNNDSGFITYEDFEFETKTGSSIELSLNSKISPSENFTVNVPSEIKEGQQYILRVENGGTAYTMTLGSGFTNPASVDLTLTPNNTDMFVFLATSSSELELQPNFEITSTDVVNALGYTPANVSNLGTAAACNTGTSSGNVPVLDSNGKLNTNTLPGVALTDTFTVTNKNDLTGLTTAEQGDIGIVTSESKTYVLSVAPYSTLANWKELLSPTDAVTSVNSKTGAVTLDADDISDSTTTNKFVTATEKSTWNGKQNALSTQTAYSAKGSATKVPQITTNTLGQVTNISEVTIAQPDISGLIAGPSSSTNGNIVVFDGTTGKLIKDSKLPIQTFVITEDMITKTTTKTYGVAPYNTSYYYTNFEIDDTKGISRVEGGIYYFVWNSMTAASSYRNVRIRIGANGDWMPLMDSAGTIISGYSYVKKSINVPYIYSTKYQSGGALHYHYDANTTYSAMSQAEIDTGTATTARSITATNLRYAISTYGGNEYNAGEGIGIGNIQDYSAMQGPAPTGFHVPLDSEWVALCGILTSTFSMASNATTMGTYLKMPMAGRRYNSSANVINMGSDGYYWSSTPFDAGYAYDLHFSSSSIVPHSPEDRTYGFSIRCFKDTPIIPASSWTTLYDGSLIAIGAGVFYNATDGLISVSGDGTTWYTIMDKNLGATTVYNQGDTETDANCGNFYQWGNNYGFTHSGEVTKSSTKVDASNYGPGNYYSSSTFITVSYDWSSVQNDDLRGGETGAVIIDNAITNTGVLSVNGQTGDVKVNGVKVAASAPASPSEGMLWYDTTNDVLKSYDGSNWNEVWKGVYGDFAIYTATSGATLTISNLTTSFEPNQDFTISAGTVKEGMQYIVRVDSGATAYNMTLGTGITNPYEEDITLSGNTMTTLVFLATSSSNLELFSVRSYNVAAPLLTYAEIVAMATDEGSPWTDTIAELNTNPQGYYSELQGHFSMEYIDFGDYGEHEYISGITSGRYHIRYYNQNFVRGREGS